MNKKIISLIFTLVIGIGLSIGLSYVHAAWSDPAGTPPGSNLYPPVTTNATAQVKEGGLSVGNFIATQQAQFDQRSFFRGSIKGGNPTVADVLRIGGNAAGGTDQYRVRTNVTGDVHSLLKLGSSELVTDQKNRLCGDGEGHVVFCPDIPPIRQPVHATFTIRYVPFGVASGAFTATLDKPIQKDITITRVFSVGFLTDNCAGSGDADSQQNNPQTLNAGSTSTSFSSQFTPGAQNWPNVKKQKVYNFLIRYDQPNGLLNEYHIVNDGDTLQFGEDTVTFDLPNCS